MGISVLREATETLRGVSHDLRTPTMASLADRIDAVADDLVAEREGLEDALTKIADGTILSTRFREIAKAALEQRRIPSGDGGTQ